jgi:hypothetical protein
VSHRRRAPLQRQARLRAVESLDLALLVHTQHQGVVRLTCPRNLEPRESWPGPWESSVSDETLGVVRKPRAVRRVGSWADSGSPEGTSHAAPEPDLSGEIAHGGKTYPGQHEAIIDPELYRTGVPPTDANDCSARRGAEPAGEPHPRCGWPPDDADACHAFRDVQGPSVPRP